MTTLRDFADDVGQELRGKLVVCASPVVRAACIARNKGQSMGDRGVVYAIAWLVRRMPLNARKSRCWPIISADQRIACANQDVVYGIGFLDNLDNEPSRRKRAGLSQNDLRCGLFCRLAVSERDADKAGAPTLGAR
jgi:hypothetical protein